MKLTAWRIVKASRAGGAFEGEGARLHGGRWNSPGTRMVYVSATASLAVLEVLVHLEGASTSLSFRLISLEFSSSLVEEFSQRKLPAHWDDLTVSPTTQRAGDAWVANARTPILRVPSAIVPMEANFLLNPLHPEFDQIRIGSPVTFRLDPRLK